MSYIEISVDNSSGIYRLSIVPGVSAETRSFGIIRGLFTYSTTADDDHRGRSLTTCLCVVWVKRWLGFLGNWSKRSKLVLNL